jgi:hypothetical protein
MGWNVEYTDEFERWWTELDEAEQDSVDWRGPSLRSPHSSDVGTSKHGNMRELRIQHQGEPYRVFYAFDPRRTAMLLIGGNKTGDDLFYERMVPIADGIYDQHLAELTRQGKAPK